MASFACGIKRRGARVCCSLVDVRASEEQSSDKMQLPVLACNIQRRGAVVGLCFVNICASVDQSLHDARMRTLDSNHQRRGAIMRRRLVDISASAEQRFDNIQMTVTTCNIKRRGAFTCLGPVQIRPVSNQHFNASHMPIETSSPQWGPSFVISLVAVSPGACQRIDHIHVALSRGPIHRTPAAFSDGAHVGPGGYQQQDVVRAAPPRAQRNQPRLAVVVAFVRVSEQQISAPAKVDCCGAAAGIGVCALVPAQDVTKTH